jgi:hypothetical protein
MPLRRPRRFDGAGDPIEVAPGPRRRWWKERSAPSRRARANEVSPRKRSRGRRPRRRASIAARGERSTHWPSFRRPRTAPYSATTVRRTALARIRPSLAATTSTMASSAGEGQSRRGGSARTAWIGARGGGQQQKARDPQGQDHHHARGPTQEIQELPERRLHGRGPGEVQVGGGWEERAGLQDDTVSGPGVRGGAPARRGRPREPRSIEGNRGARAQKAHGGL